MKEARRQSRCGGGGVSQGRVRLISFEIWEVIWEEIWAFGEESGLTSGTKFPVKC